MRVKDCEYVRDMEYEKRKRTLIRPAVEIGGLSYLGLPIILHDSWVLFPPCLFGDIQLLLVYYNIDYCLRFCYVWRVNSPHIYYSLWSFVCSSSVFRYLLGPIFYLLFPLGGFVASTHARRRHSTLPHTVVICFWRETVQSLFIGRFVSQQNGR